MRVIVPFRHSEVRRVKVTLDTLGWFLIAAGLVLYGGSIAIAVVRVRRQYSSYMPGRKLFSWGAALWTAVTHAYLLLPVIAGAILLLLGK